MGVEHLELITLSPAASREETIKDMQDLFAHIEPLQREASAARFDGWLRLIAGEVSDEV